MGAVSNNIDKKRMAKNTLLLYFRMAFAMLFGFYAVRLLLQYLGVDDYGLYNIICGLVGMFTFFSGAMATAIQRFLCYEMGQRQLENAKNVFSMSVFLFLILAAIFLIIAETIGLWLTKNELNIPAGKADVALIIYQLSIFMVLFKMLQIPYIAVITSHENMGIFSYISIADTFLHFLSILSLRFVPYNRLITFSSLYTVSNLLIFFLYAVYCYKKYDMCRGGIKFSHKYFKSLISFFSWNLLGSVANISRQQGINLLLNIFCGVVFNATWGIANQIGSAIYQFISSFQHAFNPQILKNYTNPDKDSFYELLQSCSKFSFLLCWLISLPLLMQTKFFLTLWLGSAIPEGAVIFSQMIIIYMLIDAVNGPLWVAVQATGNIRRYQIEISLLTALSFVLSWIALKFGVPACSVAVISAAVNGVTFLYRLNYLKKAIAFPIPSFCVKSLCPILLTVLFGIFAGLFLKLVPRMNILGYLCLITILNILSVILIGLSSSEKQSLLIYIRSKVLKCLK